MLEINLTKMQRKFQGLKERMVKKMEEKVTDSVKDAAKEVIEEKADEVVESVKGMDFAPYAFIFGLIVGLMLGKKTVVNVYPH